MIVPTEKMLIISYYSKKVGYSIIAEALIYGLFFFLLVLILKIFYVYWIILYIHPCICFILTVNVCCSRLVDTIVFEVFGGAETG